MTLVPRITRIIAANGVVIAATLVVVSLLAFGGAWVTFTDVRTVEFTEQVNQQRVETRLGTSAVVTGESSLYERGEELQNKSAYFLRATPELTLELTTRVPSGQQVTVSHEITLQFRATRDDEPFWESTELLLREQDRTSTGRVTSSVTVNVSEIQETVSVRREEIGTVGILQTNLLVNVSYETNRYSGTFAEPTSLVLTGPAYWLASDVSESRTHAETVTRTARRAPNPLAYGGLAAVGLLALAGAGGVLHLRRQVDLVEIETRLYRAEYEEWISEGEFPTGTNKKHVRINSLEDLVDVAIDTNKRVLYDPEVDIYAVIDSDIIFYFSTEPAGIDAWLDV